MSLIEDATSVNGEKCVQFVPRKTQANYVQLSMKRQCWSDLGRVGNGRQTVSLGRNCYTHGTVMHELLHTLGFYHEQSRADRDFYVDIHRENIKQGAESNFDRYALGTTVDHLDQPYDYDSIMHYQSTSFSKDFVSPTITAKQQLPSSIVLGQRDHLSHIDIRMIQKLYGCQSSRAQVVNNKQCQDNLENCHLYGEFACKELPEWAAENCRLTCGICKNTCEDKVKNCDQYEEGVCENYVVWATENCAKFCGLGNCKALAKPTTTEGPKCEDTISDCIHYGKSVCVTHKPWASVRCQKFCGFCSNEEKTTEAPTTTPTTTSNECADRIDCSSFPHSACTNYRTYMSANCPYHCALCPGQEPLTTPKPPTTKTTTTTTTSTTTTPTTTTQPTTKPTTTYGGIVKCEDKIDNCAEYPKSVCANYLAWTKINCARYCGHCSDCADVRPDCNDFYKSQCTGIYMPYMKQQCAKFCDYC
ncbi:ASTL [Bugula neritina]|uniref:Metalloendopeptidase n=1 Tax=Bugula neritina TaxID=10212 RepID=A0A7J7IWQ0_BUGNE|nr:ASTL [Bugula neritina]